MLSKICETKKKLYLRNFLRSFKLFCYTELYGVIYSQRFFKEMIKIKNIVLK